MRSIKFRAFINGEMIYDLAYEEYAPINDLLEGTDNLMQFTGLFDKQGVEIYEGDIVKIGIDFGFRKRIILNGTQALFGEVLFDKCSFIYRHKSQGDISLFGIDNNDWCEVVGNIYENQEILKG